MNICIYLSRIWNDITDYSKFDHIYIYAHQSHFYPYIFSNLSDLSNNCTIYFLQSRYKLSGYEGYEHSQDLLVKNTEIKKDNIKPISFLYGHEKMINTMNESLSVIEYCRNNNISNILLVSTVFHIPRAFISFLSGSIKLEYKMNIFAHRCGYIDNWENKKFIHSQGIQEGTINELLLCELEKINKYFRKGDLISIEDTLKYLNNRVFKIN